MHHRSTSLSTQGVWMCMAFVLIIQIVCSSPTQRTPPLLTHHLTKRSFYDIQCKGVYDKSIFARLDRICEDCYNLYREPQVHSLCRKNCFTSDFFKGCVDSLQLADEVEEIKRALKIIHGVPPPTTSPGLI